MTLHLAMCTVCTAFFRFLFLSRFSSVYFTLRFEVHISLRRVPLNLCLFPCKVQICMFVIFV